MKNVDRITRTVVRRCKGIYDYFAVLLIRFLLVFL